MLALIPFSAVAYTPPAFVDGQRVYLVPDDTSVVTTHTLAAAAEAEHPVVVVFANNVVDNERGAEWSSDTEDAIEDTWALWSQEADFQADITSVVLIGMDDREIRILTGSTWDADLGLTGAALSELTKRHFVPQARAGNLDVATQRTVAALDQEISRRIAWEAGSEDRLRVEEGDRRAREARMAQLEQERREDQTRLAIQLEGQRDTLRLGVTVAGVVFIGFGSFGAIGLFVGTRRRRRQRASRRLRTAVSAMTQRLATANELVADLRLQSDARDGVLALRLKGPYTNFLLDSVTEALDHIQVRLNAMRHHLDRIVTKAKAVSAFNAASFNALRRELENGFIYAPETARDKLFAQSEPIVVDFPVFEAELQVRYDEANAGWNRLLDAVDASMRRSSDDLPLHGLQQAMGLVQALDLPLGWVKPHPLFEDVDAAMAELDALRISDPVHYLDVMDNIHQAEDTVIDALHAIQQNRNAVLLARDHAESLTTPNNVVLEDDQNPDEAIALAEDATETFEGYIRAVSDLELVSDAGDVAIAAWDEVTTRHERIALAFQTLPTGLLTATTDIAALVSRREQERVELRRLSDHHKNLADATEEMEEASVDVDQATDALRDAHAAFNRKALVTALGAIELAVAEQEEALEDLQEMRVLTQQLVRNRDQVVTLWDSLDALRMKMTAELVAMSSPLAGRGAIFRPGDAARDALLGEWEHAGDWQLRAVRVKQISSAWRSEVANEKQRIDKAAANALALSRSRARTSSGFWGSSESSSGMRSAGSSWGSSTSRSSSSSSSSSSYSSSRSRSGSSSYSSSSSRSGGSSYKPSGGRSGGSKW
ncbi:MAG: tetratricopeptide (TPR) repeat protein [Myxococcota bacterium]|jgi:tetratricopeptide (TPR) repeat protein